MRLLRPPYVILAALLPLLGVLIGVQPAFAQAGPLQVPTPPGLGELLSNPGGWLVSMFNNALVSMSQDAMGTVVGFMNLLLGDGNVISQTPPSLSYDNQSVHDLWDGMRGIANGGLAAVAVIGGLNVIVSPHMRTPYHGALEVVPRLLLSGIMLNSSLYWGRFVIDLNNVLCQAIGSHALPGLDVAEQAPSGGTLLLNLIAMAVYVVLGMLLMGQMLMRLALVDVLLVIAPLALLCWVLPQTYTWARLWFTTFFGTVFVQAIQVLVLRLGADLMQHLPGLLVAIGSNPLQGWQAWMATLLLGMAVLQLTRKVPRLMPGVVGGLGGAYAGPNIRQLTTLFNSGNNTNSTNKTQNQKGGR